jgi:hypothetical protein
VVIGRLGSKFPFHTIINSRQRSTDTFTSSIERVTITSTQPSSIISRFINERRRLDEGRGLIDGIAGRPNEESRLDDRKRPTGYVKHWHSSQVHGRTWRFIICS